jgi:hypothetical protein
MSEPSTDPLRVERDQRRGMTVMAIILALMIGYWMGSADGYVEGFDKAARKMSRDFPQEPR